MIAVIFEVWPKDGHREAYLDIATRLKDDLATVPGFVSVERFESLTSPGKLLSLSFFDNEDALKDWRSRAHHRKAQASGRQTHFEDYRLRIAGVIRDYGLNDREQAPNDSRIHHG